MCGLYGIFGPGITKEDLQIVGLLGFLNMQRGIHSTGVAQIWYDDNRVKPKITKDVMPAMYFFNKKENRELLTDSTVYALMCHNRYATVGNSDNVDGAHPFETERFIGFHNGTLRETKYSDHPNFLTDSEALWNDITERGFVDTLSPLYEDSAFALAYYDKVEKQIGFVRNNKRPLSFACHPTRSVVYYSSDMNDLKYTLNKANIDAHYYSLSTWSHIHTDPRKMNFNDVGGENGTKKKRTNLWFIDDIKPNPEKPPVVTRTVSNFQCTTTPTAGTMIPRRGNWNGKGTCRICDDRLVLKKSVDVPRFGTICDDCDGILYMNYNIDSQDEMESHAVTYYADNVKDDRKMDRRGRLALVN